MSGGGPTGLMAGGLFFVLFTCFVCFSVYLFVCLLFTLTVSEGWLVGLVAGGFILFSSSCVSLFVCCDEMGDLYQRKSDFLTAGLIFDVCFITCLLVFPSNCVNGGLVSVQVIFVCLCLFFGFFSAFSSAFFCVCWS